MEPIINLEGYRIKRLLIETIDEEIDTKPLNIEVTTGIDDKKSSAVLTIEVTLNIEEKKIELAVDGVFSIGDNFREKDAEIIENTLRVNGTALVYPYVRSMISVISSLDSETAILLPTLNTNIFN